MNKEEARSSIEALPNECLFEVFRRLLDGQSRSAAACVSKQWLILVSHLHKSEMLFPNPNVVDAAVTRHIGDGEATDIGLAALSVGASSSGGGVKELKISFTFEVTDAGLKSVAYSSPSLRILSLRYVPFVGDEGLLEIAKECHMLEELDLCLCPYLTNKGLIAMAKSMPCLTSIVVEYCESVGDESLQEIGLCCPRLTSVCIKDCPLVGDQGVASVVFSTSSVLSELKLQNLSIGDKTLAEIGRQGKALTTLVLTELEGVTTNGFSLMCKLNGLKKLVSLTVTSCPGLKDEALHAIGDGCPSLKWMHLCECTFLSDNGIRVFVEASSSLESLHLEECNRITLGVLRELSSLGSKLEKLELVECMGIDWFVPETSTLFLCESLRSLSIVRCSGLRNRSLAMLRTFFPNLEYINLTGHSRIGDSGLLPIVQNCCGAGLVKVNLDGCVNLTDDVVSVIAKLHGRTLEKLYLSGCSKVTDASLVAIACNCLVLVVLDLSGCSITDFGVATLTLKGLSNLNGLSISGCSKVSDMSMPFLLKLNKNLSWFNLSGCDSLSYSTVRELGFDPGLYSDLENTSS